MTARPYQKNLPVAEKLVGDATAESTGLSTGKSGGKRGPGVKGEFGE
jgi:hypothetical protein